MKFTVTITNGKGEVFEKIVNVEKQAQQFINETIPQHLTFHKKVLQGWNVYRSY